MASALGTTRLFQLEEAESMLPLLRSIIKGMMDDHAERDALSERLETVDPDDDQAAALEREIEALTQKLLEAVGEIEELGAEFKGIEPGLVDFPTVRDGEIVYLCWRYGEDRIAHWHSVDAGFAGRRLLDRD